MKAGNDPANSRKPRQIYRCFLLRCRLAPEASPAAGDCAGRGPGWRFTVQEAGRDAERRSFTCLKDLEAYLEAELESTATHGATGGLP